MHLRRSEVVEALQAIVQTLADCPFEIDGEEIEDFVQADGFEHGGLILSGKFQVTSRGGPENDYEGSRDCTVIYQTTGADRAAREAARDAFVDALIAKIAEDRTLGLDAQVCAEIGDGTEQSAAPVPDAAGLSEAIITVDILYVAASAAG